MHSCQVLQLESQEQNLGEKAGNFAFAKPGLPWGIILTLVLKNICVLVFIVTPVLPVPSSQTLSKKLQSDRGEGEVCKERRAVHAGRNLNSLARLSAKTHPTHFQKYFITDFSKAASL